MYNYIMEKTSVYNYMSNCRKRKFSKKCLLIAFNAFSGKAELLCGFYHSIGISALLVSTSSFTDFRY